MILLENRIPIHLIAFLNFSLEPSHSLLQVFFPFSSILPSRRMRRDGGFSREITPTLISRVQSLGSD